LDPTLSRAARGASEAVEDAPDRELVRHERAQAHAPSTAGAHQRVRLVVLETFKEGQSIYKRP
jgi:hypothetical protein